MQKIPLEMTNFDHSIDPGMAEALKDKPGDVFSHHFGWNFCGRVFFSDGQFHEDVQIYGTVVETLSADTLEELMTKVNAKYGSD